eukprot:jgi/Chlat1/7555/Chrsp63S07055
MRLAWVLAAAAAARVLVITYGHWQDTHLPVKYTDIDYTVFSDAAALMAKGLSPYQRSTYRYTPLLAALLLPNVYVHPLFGKLLFATADLVTAWLAHTLLLMRGVSSGEAVKLLVCTWLFNPFVLPVATRGNCEALVTALLLGVILALARGRFTLAAIGQVLYGLAVHMRIYPIIYCLAIVLALDQTAKTLLTRQRILFAVVSAGTFLGLTASSYALYGNEFLNEALLYHAVRKDPRHNFSIYFYSIYLNYGKELMPGASLLTFVPQAVLFLVLSVKFSKDLPFCWFTQTLAFVAFNKVCTAQYFVWYMGYLPLVLSSSSMRVKWRGAACFAAWSLAQMHWLAWAYFLEFQGRPVFLELWVASLAFLASNVYLLASAIVYCRPSTVVERIPASSKQHFQ